MTPREGLERLDAILRKPARFGPVGVVVGHTILTVGLAIVLMPTLTNLAAAAVLGAIVGVLKVFNRDRPVLAVPLPVVAATLVSALVFLAIQRGLPVDPLHVLVPPLVTFLPGGMLTLGMVELAYGDMVSGSSRLIAGFVQLVLLAFGLAAGAMLVGYAPTNLLDSTDDARQRSWAPWAGVRGVRAGRLSPLLRAAELAAVDAPRAAGRLRGTAAGRRPLGNEISGFFGMLVATPLGYLIQLRFRGPPAMVTFLPSFWLLVPGALGLLSVTRMLSDRAAGIDGLITVVFVFASIALGTLVGASLYKWLTERFGWWQLQIGRVGRYFRRGKKR